MKEGKKLRIWNGRGHGRYSYFYVAAYSRAEAARLIAQAAGYANRGFEQEVKDYYSETWGTPMKGIIPTEPCVYAQLTENDKPQKVI